MKSPFKIPTKLIEISINSQHLEFLQAMFRTFHKENKELIDDYLYMKAKLSELESILNLNYKLTISNSKTSGKVINAQVKLPFARNENTKSKYPFFNVHVGKLIDYKLGLKDPQVKIDAEQKIKEFIDRKYPFSILNADNQQLEFHF